jgi:uncharacterized protein YacL (UPF0231 family)
MGRLLISFTTCAGRCTMAHQTVVNWFNGYIYAKIFPACVLISRILKL